MVRDDEQPEDKLQKRMKRNRESAARSRNAKRQYIEMLEQQVNILKQQVSSLERENASMRAALKAETPPVAVEVTLQTFDVSDSLEDVFGDHPLLI